MSTPIKATAAGICYVTAMTALLTCALTLVACFFDVASLSIVAIAQYLNVNDVREISDLARMCVSLRLQAYSGAFVVFNIYSFVLGYVALR